MLYFNGHWKFPLSMVSRGPLLCYSRKKGVYSIPFMYHWKEGVCPIFPLKMGGLFYICWPQKRGSIRDKESLHVHLFNGSTPRVNILNQVNVDWHVCFSLLQRRVWKHQDQKERVRRRKRVDSQQTWTYRQIQLQPNDEMSICFTFRDFYHEPLQGGLPAPDSL